MKKSSKNGKRKNRNKEQGRAKVTRSFLRFLTEAKGRKPGSIRKAEYALVRWNKANPKHNFDERLSIDAILNFKAKLRDRSPGGKALSPGTVMDILIQMRQFFEWLSLQPGYKSKINATDLQYFQPSPDETSYRKYHKSNDYPTLTQVKMLVDSVPNYLPVDMRDRALIAFLLLSGIRIDAAASLTIGCFNRSKMKITQDPRDGVRTKFSKCIVTFLIDFDEDLFDVVAHWYDYLTLRGYGNRDPLFPKAKTEQDGLAFVVSTDLTKEFISASQMRRVIKQRCLAADMPYFKPHSFRHACTALAIERASDAQEIKALSINLGHESAVHVIDTYGQLPEKKMEMIIRNLGRKKDDE